MSLARVAARLGLQQLGPSIARPAVCTATTRNASSAAPAAQDAEEPDIVVEAFKEQQTHYRALLEGMQKLPLPLSGDEAALKRYAEQMESLKKKIGVPDIDEVIEATLDYKLQSTGGNLKKYLSSAAENVNMADYQEAWNELLQGVEAVEQESGEPVDFGSDQKVWDKIASKIEAVQKKYGLEDYPKIKDAAILEMYKDLIDKVKSKALEDIEVVKRRDGLDWLQVDPAALKPKPL